MSGESMLIRAEDAVHPAERQPVIRIIASVEISGNESVSPELLAYAARQFARTLAAKVEAAADDLEARAAQDGGGGG